jgi:osmotically-inducible protein OsmY
MYPHIQQSELEQRIKLHLAATRPELSRLDVRADGGTVRLSGQVASFYLRQLALSAVKRVAGVLCVSDDIEVPVLHVQNYRHASSGMGAIRTRREGRYFAADSEVLPRARQSD